MPGFHTAVLTVLAMLAFAANSLLCRLALQSHAIDAASFTAVRLVSGALVLALVVQATMVGVGVGVGLCRGERLALRQWAGLVLALGGLVVLLRPGLSAPPWGAAGLMLLAGVAWGGIFAARQGAKDPVGG
ncbi:Uncharacterised protein [Comamonas aquatica]|nr:Uncharacterised protein [Comamonas aquatica]